MTSQRRIRARDIIRDIRSGMNDRQVRAKYELSEKGLAKALEQLRQRSDSKAVEIVEDIRAGMTDFELAKKYRLSSKGLQAALKQLVTRELIQESELHGRRDYYEDAINFGELRQWPRAEPAYPIPVLHGDRPEISGTLLDVSRGGVGVKGIPAKVDDVTNLIVVADEYGEFGEFSFKARCRWMKKRYGGIYIGGFQIVSISAGSLEELQCLLKSDVPGD
jgi:uncharacterized protein (DUF433 family)